MLRRTVVISREAQADFGEILKYISRDSPSRGERFVLELRQRCERIGRFPFSGRSRWDIDPNLRSVSHKGYVIFYEIFDNRVGIVRVAHGSRDLPALFRSAD